MRSPQNILSFYLMVSRNNHHHYHGNMSPFIFRSLPRPQSHSFFRGLFSLSLFIVFQAFTSKIRGLWSQCWQKWLKSEFFREVMWRGQIFCDIVITPTLPLFRALLCDNESYRSDLRSETLTTLLEWCLSQLCTGWGQPLFKNGGQPSNWFLPSSALACTLLASTAQNSWN